MTSVASPAGPWPPAGDVGPIPLPRFRDEVLALYKPPLRAKNTFNKMRQALSIAVELAGPGATTADLSPELIARIIGSRPAGESPNSTLSLLSSFRAACAYAQTRGYVRVTPFAYRKQWLRPAPTTKAHAHSQEDIARVLALLKADVEAREGWAQWRARRLYALAATFAYTGLRRNEGLYLHVEDVDLAGRMLLIVERGGRHLKTRASAQPVPIPPALAEILDDWLRPEHRLWMADVAADACPWVFPNTFRVGPWTGGPMGQKPLDRLKAAGERAGVDGFSFLSLRHSWATHAEAWGLSPAMIQRILRHTSLRTQWHYRHADTANLKAAVHGVRFGPPGGTP